MDRPASQSNTGQEGGVFWTQKRGLIPVFVAAILALGTLLVTGCGNEATTGGSDTVVGADTTAAVDDGKVYSLKFSIHDAAGSPEDRIWGAWATRVAEATNGRVKIDVYPGAILGKPTDGMNMVKSGICDIIWTYTGFFPGEFDCYDVMSLPFMGWKTGADTVPIAHELLATNANIQKEFAGVKVLTLYAGPGSIIGSHKPIESVDDLKNLKIRTAGALVTKLFTEYGAAPVAMPPTDIYEALEKNVVDAYIFDASGVESYKLEEPVDYILDIKMFAAPMMVLMNKGKWDELPADLQEAITKLAGPEMANAALKELDALVAGQAQRFRDKGTTVTVPTAEVLAGFAPVADKIKIEWAEGLDARGLDGTELYNATLGLVEKHIK